jgi:hypothetical protein
VSRNVIVSRLTAAAWSDVSSCTRVSMIRLPDFKPCARLGFQQAQFPKLPQ